MPMTLRVCDLSPKIVYLGKNFFFASEIMYNTRIDKWTDSDILSKDWYIKLSKWYKTFTKFLAWHWFIINDINFVLKKMTEDNILNNKLVYTYPSTAHCRHCKIIENVSLN